MKDRTLKFLAVASTVAGTVGGLVLRTFFDIGADTGALVGFFSMVATPIGVALGLLLFLVLSQHAGTREKLEELYALVVTLPAKSEELRSDIRTFSSDLRSVGRVFGNGTVSRVAKADFARMLKRAPKDCQRELADRWGKLISIATTRLPVQLWVGLFATNFFASIFVAMVQFTPITTVVVLTGWNLLLGGLAVLIADFDDPFTGWFNIRNPFAEKGDV